jgi:riboflavin synthase
MFSGIVEKTGTIIDFKKDILTIQESSLSKELQISESIAIDGICLTVIDKQGTNFKVQVTPETVSRTNLKALTNTDIVNLEKPLRYNGLVGGHLVQGHVDCKGKIENIIVDGNSKILTISFPTEYEKYIVEKGYIAVDGISLTIVECENNYFSLSIIPFTFDNTNLKYKNIKQNVNLEFDITSKYVEKILNTK